MRKYVWLFKKIISLYFPSLLRCMLTILEHISKHRALHQHTWLMSNGIYDKLWKIQQNCTNLHNLDETQVELYEKDLQVKSSWPHQKININTRLKQCWNIIYTKCTYLSPTGLLSCICQQLHASAILVSSFAINLFSILQLLTIMQVITMTFRIRWTSLGDYWMPHLNLYRLSLKATTWIFPDHRILVGSLHVTQETQGSDVQSVRKI